VNCDVLVIGCGVVGCAIAYELAAAGLSVIGVDAGEPASGATGASLGVLMGVCSRQPSGEVVELRLKSLEQFDPLIARLEADLGRTLPVNRRGILRLLQGGGGSSLARDPGSSSTGGLWPPVAESGGGEIPAAWPA
jgi:glycine oxidase